MKKRMKSNWGTLDVFEMISASRILMYLIDMTDNYGLKSLANIADSTTFRWF